MRTFAKTPGARGWCAGALVTALHSTPLHNHRRLRHIVWCWWCRDAVFVVSGASSGIGLQFAATLLQRSRALSATALLFCTCFRRAPLLRAQAPWLIFVALPGVARGTAINPAIVLGRRGHGRLPGPH